MRSVDQSLKEYARGVAGGLLFSLPLLCTMEVWWFGIVAHPWRLSIYVAATFVLLLGYNFFVGLRHDANFAEVAIDSVEEMGLGLLISVVALWALGRIEMGMTPGEIVGVTVIEAMTVAIGVSVGTAQLGGENNSDKGEGESEGVGERGDNAGRNEERKNSPASGGQNEEPSQEQAGATREEGMRATSGIGRKNRHVSIGGQVVVAWCGAVLFAANLAPTEEIVMLAAQISVWRVLGLALLSLALGALILYYSDLAGAEKFIKHIAHHGVLPGTVVTYAVALAASASILWFFGRFDGLPLVGCLAETVVLGVAAMMGAAAGRLLLQ